MSTEAVTLLAASIAATASIVVLVVQVISGRASEARESHRQLLGPLIEELGGTLHEVMAISNVLIKRYDSGKDVGQWLTEADRAANQMKVLRVRARYPLWGLDRALRTMSRVPNWITHYKERPEEGKQWLDDVDHLRKALDLLLADAYRKGSPPSNRAAARVEKLAQRVELKRITKAQEEPDEELADIP